MSAGLAVGTALKAFAPFADLSDEERSDIADLLEERILSPGETLFALGDDAEALVLVVEGAVTISSPRVAEPAQLGAGAVIGGAALFTVGARESSAAGAERSQLLLLRREDFLRLAEDNPRTACRVAMALSAELALHLRGALRELVVASVDPVRGDE